ncbi:MAG: pyrroloquinoline quinone precursor peptide PqqA [Limnobacter sp.]|nr:pyrroloquinoline quinone precursor peptide PqqA [Limnobacter sp.]MDP3188078.1 pyrroloquinoline quinone precursor peptide PqqA [Limnobacter sp.]
MATKSSRFKTNFGEVDMSWSTPQFVDMRFGFEITMYIANR